jgi:multidrug resistance efflux pump
MARARLLGSLGLAATLLYIGWIGAPYLHSVIVRDAALTTWVNATAAPISGTVDSNPLYPGERVGADGRIVGVDNPRADRTALAQARAELTRAEGRVAALGKLAKALTLAVSEREATAASYAATFKQDLDATIAGASNRLAITKRRLEIERSQSNRSSELAQRGAGSLAAAEAASGRLAEQERVLSESQTTIDRTSLRRQAAEAGVLLLDDGTDAGLAKRALDDARLKLGQTEADLAAAQVDVAAARAVVDAALNMYEKARAAIVVAPAGSLVWSLMTAPGAAVQPGTPIATWIDCRVMLVDVPVSDVEIALLSNGAAADIVIEGELKTRHGAVMLLRGAAATVGQADLAALAKGRRPGIGQALVRLEPTAADIEACPVGHAAYADFPTVSIIDIVRARLRL